MQKWYLPIGCAVGVSGKILVADTDRDSCPEIFISDFQYPDKINVCELHLPNTWEMDSFANMPGEIAWDIGDFDCDGLWDLLCWGSYGTPDQMFFVTESPDSFSYPTHETWRDTMNVSALDIGDEVFDIDQDGYPELVKNCASPYGSLGMYEYVSDNQYDLIFTDTTTHGSPLGTHAFGDFDQDGHNEVVFAGADRTYWIYESPANNIYERLRFDTLPTNNIRDCCEVEDADRDGKWEFVLKGNRGIIDAFIFEATGNNAYDTIKVFHFPGDDYCGGHSDADDVDGDSIPEMVLSCRQTVYIIKAAGNDSFYVWETLPGNAAGFNIKIFDLDNNGLNDIIMSGAQQTWIYEYSPEGVEEQRASYLEPISLNISPNPMRDNLVIKYQISNNKYQMNVKDQNYVQSSKPEGLPYIRIFNTAGQLIKQFNHLTVQPFNHVIWDGSDDEGHRVAAGVYFIQLSSDDEKSMEKIVLIR